MKKLSFFALAMTGMLFAACADKDVVAEDNVQGELRPDGYMALNINLPTAPVTRAVNDDFDDGEPYEYNVVDCALLLFEAEIANDGTVNEEDAKLLNAQAILMPFDETVEDDDKDNITTSYKLTAKVKGFNNDGKHKLLALALLNYKNLMSIDNDNMPTIANTRFAEDDPFSKIRALMTDVDLETLIMRGGKRNYFFMTNAILSKTPGGIYNPSNTYTYVVNQETGETTTVESGVFQLAEMKADRIYETEKDAKENPAGDIVVERAVAKATLEMETNEIVLREGDSENEIPSVTLAISNVEWAIDNMEPKTYVTRNPGKLEYINYLSGYYADLDRKNYRFVGDNSTMNNTSLGTDEPAFRTYWCIDPQYDDTEIVDGKKTVKNAVGMLPAKGFYALGEKNPLYCFENTFDVAHQSYRNTTRAIIKVTTDGEDFYTVNGGIEMFKDPKEAVSYVVNNIVNNTSVLNLFKENLDKTKENTYEITGKSFDIEYERNSTTGQYEVVSLKLSDDVTVDNSDKFEGGFDNDNDDVKSVLKDAMVTANERVVVRSYQNGVMYYEARFQHFAGAEPGVTDLAPWHQKGSTWEGTVSGGSTEVAYPTGQDGRTPEENYLGRYGMVRNNWYYVVVDAIKNLGYPEDPSGQVNNPKFDDPDTPDDNIKEYLSAKIHVLSWAKRLQNWGF